MEKETESRRSAGRQGRPEDWLDQVRAQLEASAEGSEAKPADPLELLPELGAELTAEAVSPPSEEASSPEGGPPAWWLPSPAEPAAGEGAGTAPRNDAAEPAPGDAAEPADGEGAGLLDELIREIDHGLELGAEVPSPGPAPEEERKERFVLFDLGTTRCAATVGTVVEIGYPLPVTPVPNVPPWVEGVGNLRGDVIAIVDFARYLELERPEPAAETEQQHRAARRRMLIARAGDEEVAAGLLVDGVRGVVELAPASLSRAESEPAGHGDRMSPYLIGVEQRGGSLLAVLDLERLLLSTRFRQLESV